MAETDKQEHLYDLVKGIGTAMLVTHSRDGGLSARPMSVAELKPDADAYFATGLDTPKVAQIEADPTAMVTFQDGSKYASITGRAHIVRDRAVIDRLWSEAWKVWFPGGKDDPSLALIKFEAEKGEYWDNSGMQGLKYVFEGIKAYLQGKRPDSDEEQFGKVKL